MADLLRALATTDVRPGEGSGVAGMYESIRLACLHGIRDSSSEAVRSRYAKSLGELAAAMHRWSGAVESEPKEDEKASKQQTLCDAVEQCLCAPLAEAMIMEDRDLCFALAQAWICFVSTMKSNQAQDEEELLRQALRPFIALKVASLTATALSPEKGGPGPDIGLGAPLSSGERPYSQACTLYIVHSGFIEHMGEFAQSEFLSMLLQNVEDDENPPPVLITQMETISVLMDALGEISTGISGNLETCLAKRLQYNCASVRRQTASTLSMLALAEPGRAARLLGSALNALKSSADALVDSSLESKEKGKPLPGTPRGWGSNRLKPEMNAVHGWSLAVGSLVSIVPSLMLGIPSHYLKVAMQIATALVEAPRCDHKGCRGVERQAGYIILGAICSTSMESISDDNLLELWDPLLGKSFLEEFEASCNQKDVRCFHVSVDKNLHDNAKTILPAGTFSCI